MDTLKKFIRYYKPYRVVFFIDLLCATIISLIDLAYPQILRTATNTLFRESSSVIMNALLPMAAGLLIMYIIQSLCKYIFLAWNPDSSVFQIVSFAWAGFGSAFGPVVLFALFWKRTNKQGAIAGMVAGGAMVFIWKYLVAPMGGAWAIYELLPAFLVACLVIVVVSLLTPPPSQEIVEEFEAVGK